MSRAARDCLALSVGWFVILVLIVLYGQGWIRQSFGDLIVVPWVIASVGVLPRLGHWVKSRVAFGLGLAVALECGQLLGSVGPDAPMWQHLIFGSTFDPWDLVHYVIGAGLAFGMEWKLNERRKDIR